MKRMLLFCTFVFAVMCHFFAITPALAEDVPIIIKNSSDSAITMAVSYHDQPRGRWVTLGWINVPAHSSQTKAIPTGSLNLYYYAFRDDGKVFQGSAANAKDKAMPVSDAPFFVRQGQKPTQGNVSTRVFKFKRADQRKFYLNF